MKAEKDVVLRPISESDTDNIVRWRNAESVRRFLYTQTELTAEQHLRYYETVVKAGKCRQYIIEVPCRGEMIDIGTVFIKNIDQRNRKGEFGIFIGEDAFRGKGYSLPAAEKMLDIAFSQLELNRVYLSVMADNGPAVMTYRKAGFVQEGILKEDYLRHDTYVDIVIMGITRKMWSTVQGE